MTLSDQEADLTTGSVPVVRVEGEAGVEDGRTRLSLRGRKWPSVQEHGALDVRTGSRRAAPGASALS